MNPKQRPSLSELKVGIFVVIACVVLALAIFAIGSQVGLLEDQFWAMTYLSNVSGLKPGDIVLLAGVEVGNVDDVRITEASELPETEQNQQILDEVAILTATLEAVQAELPEARDELTGVRQRYNQAVQQQGRNSTQARNLADEVEEAEDRVEDLVDRIEDLAEETERQRSRLQNIRILMRINSRYRSWIREDSDISLGSIGLLGDKYIEISLGRSPTPPRTVERDMEGWLFSSQEEVVLITGTQQATFEELITGANDILANFETLSSKVEDILENFEAGEGSIGKFFSDPSFYDNLNETVENANAAVQKISGTVGDVTQGQGTVPLLIKEREVYDRIAGATDRLESIMNRIEQGEGTLGQLVNDPAVYRNTEAMLENLQGITERMDTGQGTLGKLSRDEQLYASLNQSVSRLATLLSRVEQGEGTLGRLTQDEELYSNLNQLSAEMVKLIYDFRQNPKEFLTIKFEIF